MIMRKDDGGYLIVFFQKRSNCLWTGCDWRAVYPVEYRGLEKVGEYFTYCDSIMVIRIVVVKIVI